MVVVGIVNRNCLENELVGIGMDCAVNRFGVDIGTVVPIVPGGSVYGYQPSIGTI